MPNLDIGQENGTEVEMKVRQQLVDVLAGKTVLARKGNGENDLGFAPWSQAYAGHQFGNFAGQLGDGRAISIRARRSPLCFINMTRPDRLFLLLLPN